MPFKPKQQPVVERAGVVEAVGVADQRVGHAAQVEQPIPVGVVARQPRDLQAEHQPGVAERDLGRQAREPRALDCPEPEMPEVLVDHHHLLAREPELERPADERVLALGRLDVALELRLGRLAHVHERLLGAGARRSASRAHSPPRLLARDRLCDHRRQQRQRRPALLLAQQLPQRRRRRRALRQIQTQLQLSASSPLGRRIIALGQDDTLKQRPEHPPRGQQVLQRPQRPRRRRVAPARSRSVHAAGINERLPSGSTRISSSRPRRRIQPISSSARPSNG